MESIVKEWVMNLFDETINEAKVAISNETLWLLASKDIESNTYHYQNIEAIKLYISVLEGLKRLFE